MRWLFIGGGNMASSLISGLLGSDPDAAPIVVDPAPKAREALVREHSIEVHSSIDDLSAEALDGAGIVLAVKPDVTPDVCRQLNETLTARGVMPALVLSVAAGVRSEALSAWLPQQTAIVRCMPNTPALLGLGASGVYAAPPAGETELQVARGLLDTAGVTVGIHSEDDLDAVTALSGSGPAYFFRLVELMIDGAVELGLDEQDARRLAVATAEGAAAMMTRTDDDPATLRRKVTSKGGTTAAALAAFDEAKLDRLVLAGMRAARDRSQALGDESLQISTENV